MSNDQENYNEEPSSTEPEKKKKKKIVKKKKTTTTNEASSEEQQSLANNKDDQQQDNANNGNADGNQNTSTADNNNKDSNAEGVKDEGKDPASGEQQSTDEVEPPDTSMMDAGFPDPVNEADRYSTSECCAILAVFFIFAALCGMAVSLYTPGWYRVEDTQYNYDFGPMRVCTHFVCDTWNYSSSTQSNLVWASDCTLTQSDLFTKTLVIQCTAGVAALFLILGFALSILTVCNVTGGAGKANVGILALVWACATTSVVFGWFQYSQGFYCNKKFCSRSGATSPCEESIQHYYWVYVAADAFIFFAMIATIVSIVTAPKSELESLSEDPEKGNSNATNNTDNSPVA